MNFLPWALAFEFEAALKHMEDYKAALNHTFHSALPLHDFCKLFVIPLPGGWPTWYYTKKIIAQLPEPSSQEHPYFSLIPEEGPFHLCLNINEDVIKSHHIKFLQDFIRRFWAVTSHWNQNPFEQASLLQEPCVDGC